MLVTLISYYEVKECLYEAPGASPRLHACVRAFARARDQNIQFLRLGQFLSNYEG